MRRRYWLLLGALLWVSLGWPVWGAETVVYYLSDPLHSVTVVTDAQRNVLERTHYAPYGQVLNRPLRDGPGYGGHREEAATGLVYMQQRYYDPESGRFLSVDPVGIDPARGGNFNRYWYANDNPYRYTDPDGRCTGSNIASFCPSATKIIQVAEHWVAQRATKAAAHVVEAIPSALHSAASGYFRDNTFAAQVSVTGTAAAPIKSGSTAPSLAVNGSATLSVNTHLQVALTGSAGAMAGAGGGATLGVSGGVSRTSGGASPTGFSFSTNQHSEATLSIPDVPFSVGASFDQSRGNQSFSAASGRASVGQMIFAGAGMQVNATYTFNQGTVDDPQHP